MDFLQLKVQADNVTVKACLSSRLLSVLALACLMLHVQSPDFESDPADWIEPTATSILAPPWQESELPSLSDGSTISPPA